MELENKNKAKNLNIFFPTLASKNPANLAVISSPSLICAESLITSPFILVIKEYPHQGHSED